jgi:pentose-5-phosphate-3-epimerase
VGLQQAGADIFVLGSFIFSHPDRPAVIRELKERLKSNPDEAPQTRK